MNVPCTQVKEIEVYAESKDERLRSFSNMICV